MSKPYYRIFSLCQFLFSANREYKYSALIMAAVLPAPRPRNGYLTRARARDEYDNVKNDR